MMRYYYFRFVSAMLKCANMVADTLLYLSSANNIQSYVC